MTREKNILIQNIYYMLAYAFTALDQSGFEDMARESFDNIHDLFAAILAKGIGRQLKQGLCRQYVPRREALTAMRGKLDMPGTIRERIARRQRLACEYDELSENELFNQILKTTVMLLLRHGDLSPRHKSELKKEMLFFSGVDEIDPGTIHWSTIRFHRSSGAYRMLLGLCRLILDGMLMTTEAGGWKLASFVDDQRMERLYEKFILEYYIRHWPRLGARASRIPWALDDGADALLPAMQSDVTLSQGGTALIIDAKFYSHTTQVQFDTHTIHSHNLYQIFTYVKNRQAADGGQVSGMLLYARTDEAVQPDSVYRMSGNQISVRTLDLNRPFPEIAGRLDAIAAAHFPACRRSASQTAISSTVRETSW